MITSWFILISCTTYAWLQGTSMRFPSVSAKQNMPCSLPWYVDPCYPVRYNRLLEYLRTHSYETKLFEPSIEYSSGCYISFITTCPFRQVKYKFNENTCPNDIFTCPKKKELFLVLKVVCSQYTFSLPNSGNCYFLVFQNACLDLILFFLSALGNQASAYVAPCSYIKYNICGYL